MIAKGCKDCAVSIGYISNDWLVDLFIVTGFKKTVTGRVYFLCSTGFYKFDLPCYNGMGTWEQTGPDTDHASHDETLF